VAREHVHDLLPKTGARQNAVDQVRPIERSDQLHGVSQAELLHDVAAHPRRRGRGERVETDLGPARAQLGELPVLGPEVMAPLADAVRFIDGHETDGAPSDDGVKAGAGRTHEPLGRDIQQPVRAGGQARHDRLPGLGRKRAVQAGGVGAVAGQRVHLVLHQRDERRDDDREAVAGEGRGLKAERLATAGRQDDERVPAREDGLHRFPLERAEGVISPVAPEDRQQGVSGRESHARNDRRPRTGGGRQSDTI
jgi:hypothetical protein